MATKTRDASVHSPPDARASMPEEPRARYLVAYYSFTGRTAKVARAVAAALGGDLEEIRDARLRAGTLGYLRALVEGARRRAAPIHPPTHRLEDYDIVILGSPVWSGAMASPMRAFLGDQKARLPRVAVFCTLGGSGGEATLNEMADLCDRAPVARLTLDDRALRSEGWRSAAEDFARHIRAHVDPKPEPAA